MNRHINTRAAMPFIVLIFQRFVWSEGSMVFSMEHPLPFIYPRTICTQSHALRYLFHKSLKECEQACQSVTRCRAINYNPATRLCILQDHYINTDSGIAKRSTAAPADCISLQVPSTDVAGSVSEDYPCSKHTCGENSMCVPLVDTSSYKCILLFCPSPPTVAHASMLMTLSTQIGYRNAYVCATGYTASSRADIRCVSTGTWTPTDFICHPNCPDIPVIDTAAMVSWFPHRLFANTTVMYACKPGHYNLTRRVVICDEDGRWSRFKCFPYCYQSKLQVLNNGAPLTGDKYTANMTAEYKCNQGYYLSPGSPLLSCDLTGAWSNLQVTCYKYCTEPAHPSRGVISALPDVPYVDGSTATFQCHDRHYSYPRDATRSAICRPNGTWSYLAECYRYCDALPGKPDGCDVGSVSTGTPYTVDTHVTYESWFVTYIGAAGNDRKTCTKDGGWDGLVACCAYGACYDYSKKKCVVKLFGC